MRSVYPEGVEGYRAGAVNDLSHRSLHRRRGRAGGNPKEGSDATTGA